MVSLTVCRVGSSLEIILPKDILEKLRVQEGDLLVVSGTPEGIHISAYNTDLKRAMEGFDRVRDHYRDALGDLAK